MREDITREYEADCLIKLLEALVNKQEIPRFERVPDWEKLYKLALFQNVTNIAYYCLLGVDDYELKPWKEKFEEHYHQAVVNEGYYGAVVPEILEELEKGSINGVLFGEYILRGFYPRVEMRELESVQILVGKDQVDKIRKIMERLDFTEEKSNKKGAYVFTKIPGLKVIFWTKLHFLNKKFTKYFDISLKTYEPFASYRCIRGFQPEELYIYLIASAAEDYAKSELDMLKILDLRCFYRAYVRVLDWKYVTKELDALKAGEFADYITKLATMWYDGLIFEKDNILLTAMEVHILTKGRKGRHESERLLSLVNEVADIYSRDLKKQQRKAARELLLPSLEYMRVMFKVLQRYPCFLPLCWVVRLLRLGRDKIFHKKA
ncbi:hypothetical protein M2454_000853 [Aequitasia blattaphilus]|uniref:Nucleotidyltransferase family protein n=1 Tax=Aequitasia blattaphilus TaxID=2949332 RepID=A0ABT1E9M8_9FIRM|nr:nucleotidyltransferase family protein [Aequitasia blattaphilus]MCP1102538.1 nucleotidyltransferase family protein [Aequitasia blattaphilus]MCR8615178.1 nucleotidyltransferase family protein [Aequitasia blattaphilus]